jgi:hypothetical protein
VSTIYYPSVAARLTIRFDEALLTGSSTPAPQTPDQGAAASVKEAAAKSHASAARLVAAAGTRQRATMFDVNADGLSHVLAIVPTQASFELPTVRQAPKFSMTFAFRDFPVDPRAIRAVGVEVFLGVVTGQDFARGIRGEVDRGRLASQISTETSNLMLVGLVDNFTMRHTDKGSEVMMDGRGLQGLLLDKKVSSAQLQQLDLSKPLDEVVRQLLRTIPQGGKIPVVAAPDETAQEPRDWPNGVPSPSAKELVTRSNQGLQGDKAQMPMKGDPGQTSVWDVITNLCFVVGAVPYFIGHQLWIRPVRSLFDQANAGSSGTTPFKGGATRSVKTAAGGSLDIQYRKMVYGRNLSNFQMERKFGGTPTSVVKVVSVDTSSSFKGKSRLLEAEWPEAKETKARTTRVDPSGKQAASEVVTIPLPGFSDKTRMREVARQIYEEIGRGELGGSASTKDLASLGGDNADTDLIRLRPGDAVEFLVDAAGLQGVPPVVSELNAEAAQSDMAAVEDLKRRLGMDARLAQVLVGTSRGRFQRLQNVFRVANVKYSWALESGIGVDFDFHNYVTARSDVEGPSVQDATVTQVGSTPASRQRIGA